MFVVGTGRSLKGEIEEPKLVPQMQQVSDH